MATVKTLLLLLAAAGCCYGQARAPQYTVPPAKLEAIYPRGLRVTVPGMLFFCFSYFLLRFQFCFEGRYVGN